MKLTCRRFSSLPFFCWSGYRALRLVLCEHQIPKVTNVTWYYQQPSVKYPKKRNIPCIACIYTPPAEWRVLDGLQWAVLLLCKFLNIWERKFPVFKGKKKHPGSRRPGARGWPSRALLRRAVVHVSNWGLGRCQKPCGGMSYRAEEVLEVRLLQRRRKKNWEN